jgi:hypothetical protein
MVAGPAKAGMFDRVRAGHRCQGSKLDAGWFDVGAGLAKVARAVVAEAAHDAGGPVAVAPKI